MTLKNISGMINNWCECLRGTETDRRLRQAVYLNLFNVNQIKQG